MKEQMGHSSIQVTVDTYGHLIPGANVCFVDRLDGVSAEEAKTSPQLPRNEVKPLIFVNSTGDLHRPPYLPK